MTDSELATLKGKRHDLVADIDKGLILAQSDPPAALAAFNEAQKKLQSMRFRIYEANHFSNEYHRGAA